MARFLRKLQTNRIFIYTPQLAARGDMVAYDPDVAKVRIEQARRKLQELKDTPAPITDPAILSDVAELAGIEAEIEELEINNAIKDTELEKQFIVLNAKLNSREQQNSKHKIKEKELRRGMRYSLREHKKECAGCNRIPTDMTPAKCGVCGNF